MTELAESIKAAVKELYKQELEPELNRPDEQFGDYATNVALQLAKQLDQPPRDIANKLAEAIAKQPNVAKAEVAGPGFINIRLTDDSLLANLKISHRQPLKGQVIVSEYSDPNPFKILHAGHLYTSVVGDAISRLLENAGAKVHRVNFGGDVGRHAAIAVWAMVQDLGGEHPEKLEQIKDRPKWMADCYVKGTAAFEENEKAKAEILELNKTIYGFHADNEHDQPLAKIYWTTRQWSYDYFEEFYAQIKITPFEKYYPESQTAPIGLEIVKEQLKKGVYEESDGAVVFKGEPYGLHTRVFINSAGLPTYEAKDVGLIFAKWRDYKFDQSIIITGNDIVEYMKVVLKSIEQFKPQLAERSRHLTHGQVKLRGGIKMSSRKGNIFKAQDVLDEAAKAAKSARSETVDKDVVLGSVKYAFLKQRIGGDIIYDPQESVSLEGNSGPYLQYAHARARSILSKAENGNSKATSADKLEPAERSLARKIGEFTEVIEQATAELLPSHITTFLYELAQSFNRFYEANRVIGDDRQAIRLRLVEAYAEALKQGLELLNISAPTKL